MAPLLHEHVCGTGFRCNRSNCDASRPTTDDHDMNVGKARVLARATARAP